MSASPLSLRPARADDARFIWSVNNDPTVRAQSINTASIEFDDHLRWFDDQLARTDRVLLIGEVDGVSVGVVRFDLEPAARTAVISIALSQDRRRRGLGTELITAATELLYRGHPVDVVRALVRTTNQASLRAFTKAGYVGGGTITQQDVTLTVLESTRPGRSSARHRSPHPASHRCR